MLYSKNRKLIFDRYEAYYNIWLGGKYIFKINELHEKYGPIVRISPSDLHVGDPVCLFYF